MGSTVLFSAARMQEIEDGTVVSGLVDVSGHLILTKHDGSTLDAGVVKGADGTDGATGPPGTLPSFLIAYKTAASAPSSYAVGISHMSVSAIDDWPAALATVQTTRYGTYRCVQVLIVQTSGKTYIRAEADSDTWGAWVETVTTASLVQVQVFTANGTWTKPTGCKSVHVLAIGAGGGGGSGRRGAAGTARVGGSGGGGGGYSVANIPAIALGATVAVTVGTAQAGGAARTTNDTSGVAGGTATDDSTFGQHVKAQKGTGGAGGATASINGGGGGNFSLFPGSVGGNAASSGKGGAVSPLTGCSGGGGGGGISTGNSADAGGNGGVSRPFYTELAGFPSGGVQNGGAGGSQAADATYQPGYGGGGGGGGNPAGGIGGTGGAGTGYGSGGGGGGGSLNGSNSGAGGAGAPGLVIVTSYF